MRERSADGSSALARRSHITHEHEQGIEEQQACHEKPDEREEVDIAALNAEIARIVAREQELRDAIDEIIADLEGGA